jgi:hypothetical protein
MVDASALTHRLELQKTLWRQHLLQEMLCSLLPGEPPCT